ncbi:hypothetical protein BN137_1623 [Cronobacter condimenti 1330]|uniref:Uncharacterized protein n=1 Tax=Cronobacter condimenti 1330 TaxID=1073999 RepID=K7ZZJ2_9ENTR|nr:hypothetical protein BN137_1623 [Cronobacter condimenti 1330]
MPQTLSYQFRVFFRVIHSSQAIREQIPLFSRQDYSASPGER